METTGCHLLDHTQSSMFAAVTSFEARSFSSSLAPTTRSVWCQLAVLVVGRWLVLALLPCIRRRGSSCGEAIEREREREPRSVGRYVRPSVHTLHSFSFLSLCSLSPSRPRPCLSSLCPFQNAKRRAFELRSSFSGSPSLVPSH